MRLIVIDDEKSQRHLLAGFLEKQNPGRKRWSF
jgi:hypothetical protein